MAERFTGRFRILNNDWIRKKAEDEKDPRHVFYKAMQSARTYNQYYDLVGLVTVQPKTTAYSVTGEMEMRYCRNQRRWIADT